MTPIWFVFFTGSFQSLLTRCLGDLSTYAGWVAFNGFLTVLAVVAALLYPHYFEGEKLVITLGYAYLLAGTPDALLTAIEHFHCLDHATGCPLTGMGHRVGMGECCPESALLACRVRWVDVHPVAAGHQEVPGARARGRPHLLQGQSTLSHRERGLIELTPKLPKSTRRARVCGIAL